MIKALFVGLTLMAGSVLIALMCAEAVVRVVAPQQLVLVRPDIWHGVDSVGWRFRPNLNTTVNWGERTVRLYTDSNGFRVGPNGPSHGPKKVLIIGDSFMAALQVEYDQSLAGLLEKDLHVAVRNAGQAGWDPPQYDIAARTLLARDTFDLVLVSVYLGNDVVTERPARIPPRLPVTIQHLRMPHSLARAELVNALIRPANDWLEQHSHLFILLKTRLQGLVMKTGMSADYFPDELRKTTANTPRWDVTAGALADIAVAGQRRHIPTLFVLIPAPFQVDTATFTEFLQAFGVDATTVDLDQPERLIGDRLRARHLDVIDVLTPFRAANEGAPPLYGHVDRHLSPRGHQVLARLVEPRIQELLR